MSADGEPSTILNLPACLAEFQNSVIDLDFDNGMSK
jgi:hypothetical protein